MRDFTGRVLGVAAMALIAVPAYAAVPASNADTTTRTADAGSSNNAAQKAADSDFGKFSQDGARAFADIDLARLEIFNGQTTKAAQDVHQAEAMLTKAQSDDTVFTKAESELKVPAGTTQHGTATSTPATTRISWLPVGGTMMIDEDYTADKTKRAGVDQADAQMKQGDSKQALKTLKLHNVDVSFVEQVAPLQASLKGVEQADTMMAQHHYFAANQALKSVDDGIRVDEQVYDEKPDSKTASNAK